MKFTPHQWSTTNWVCITVGIFGWSIADKIPPYGLALSVALVVAAAFVALYVRFNTDMPPVEEEEEAEEVLERESTFYLTARELIDILERIPDDSVVVVDGDGNPITNVLSAVFDEDFKTAVWLVGFPVNRGMYRLTQKTKPEEPVKAIEPDTTSPPVPALEEAS